MNTQGSDAEVYRTPGEMEARVIMDLLESHGVPCVLNSHTTPSAHTLTVNGLGEFWIIVPGAMAAATRMLIRRDKDA